MSFRVGNAFSDPRVTMRQPQPVVLIRGTLNPAHVSAFYATAFPELASWLNLNRIPVSGPPVTLSHIASSTMMEVAAAYPVTVKVPTTQRITMGTLPGGPVASLIVQGSHEFLADGYDHLRAWLGENGYGPGPVSWASYIRLPDEHGDQRACVTELSWPIA